MTTARRSRVSSDFNDSEASTWIEWNFDAVPDDEVVACCLWEYARDSATINMVADIHWCSGRHIWKREEYKNNPSSKLEDDKEAAIIKSRAGATKFDYESFSKNLWETDFAQIEIYRSLLEYVGTDTRSWPKLPPQLRAKLVNQVSQSYTLASLKHASVGELEQLWLANRTYLEEIRSRPIAPDDDSEEMALLNDTKSVDVPEEKLSEPSKTVASAFTIDFARYSDQEITFAFQKWLTQNRPARWQKPKRVFPLSPQKGKRILEYRVAVERLGLMRLLHFYSPTQLRRYVPEAWSKYHQKQPYFRRELQAARAFFHKIFPFVPKKENPFYGERLGKWLPPMMKICDAVERDMEKGGIKWQIN